MEKSIIEIFSKTDETKNSQIKGEQQLLELNKTITLIFEKFSENEREKVEIEKIMKDIQIEIKDISATIQSFKGGRIKICPGTKFLLIHLFPMHPFSIPENIRKPHGFLMIQGIDKGCIKNEWVNSSTPRKQI